MSTTETRRPLAQAEALARALVADLASACERIEVAGSIRRRKPDIGDIELVAIPRYSHDTDLFGDATGQMVDLLDERVAWLLKAGAIDPRLDVNGRQRLGPKYKALTYRSMNVDLFAVTAPTWGVQLVIRTGPADFSHRLVMRRSEHLPNGRAGLLPEHLRVREGRLWDSGGRPLATPTEESVFAAIGLPWIAPEARR